MTRKFKYKFVSWDKAVTITQCVHADCYTTAYDLAWRDVARILGEDPEAIPSGRIAVNEVKEYPDSQLTDEEVGYGARDILLTVTAALLLVFIALFIKGTFFP